jgi:GT2 family glycosyltransferase
LRLRERGGDCGPRALFDEIGGFARDYAPAYYEDTDLAFAVRALGKRVLYQPDAVVVHDEGGTAGTDTSTGAKAYQVRNQSRFASAGARRWPRRIRRARSRRPRRCTRASRRS